MSETWKDVDGFEGLYQVSNIGNVRSSYYNNFKGNDFNKILKQKQTSAGYKSVDLCKDGKKYFRLVHRLVAIAFIFSLSPSSES